MNAWFTRLLAGAACTVGALALTTGAAHADDHDGGLDLGIVKVSTHHDKSCSSKSSSHKSSSSRSHPGGLKVSLRTPVKVRADVDLGSRHSSTSVRVGGGGSSRSNDGTAVKVRVGTGNSSSHRSTSTVRSNGRTSRSRPTRRP